MNIAVIKHTCDYRGDHSADVRESYIFPKEITLGELLYELNLDVTHRDWVEIPFQAK